MKVFVLMESKYGSELQFVGVFATKGAAGEVVVDTMAGMHGCKYHCEVRELEVIGSKDTCLSCDVEIVDGGSWGYCTSCAKSEFDRLAKEQSK